MSQEAESIFRQGREARTQGAAIDHNPYVYDQYQAYIWELGWEQREAEILALNTSLSRRKVTNFSDAARKDAARALMDLALLVMSDAEVLDGGMIVDDREEWVSLVSNIKLSK